MYSLNGPATKMIVNIALRIGISLQSFKVRRRAVYNLQTPLYINTTAPNKHDQMVPKVVFYRSQQIYKLRLTLPLVD